MTVKIMPKIVTQSLTEAKIKRLKDGVFSDGNNLYLTLKGQSRSWTFRYKSPLTGRIRMMGLGGYPLVTLSMARKLAEENKMILFNGNDPLYERQMGNIEGKNNHKSFKEVALAFVDAKENQWRGRSTKKEILSLLENYVFPVFEDKRIKMITSDDVLDLLKPIWKDKTKTGVKVQGLLDRVFKYATARGWFFGQNPARWKGFLENLLPKPTIITTINHRKAYDWQKINKLYLSLCQTDTVPNLTARFICLTACRSAEAREMTIDEIDFKKKLWTLPASRSKTNKEHVTPLTDEAMDIIAKARQHNKTDYVFELNRKPIYNRAVLDAVKDASKDYDMTLHGFRSSFRDWGSEATNTQSEVIEMALGHAIKSKVESAYRRGDLLDKRRILMNEWTKHCMG